MKKIKINIVGGAPAIKPKLNRGGDPYMTLEEIIEHNTLPIAELRKINKYWNLLRVPVVHVADQIKITTDRLNKQDMIGWVYQRSQISTDVVLILPYNKKYGITAVFKEGEYEYI